MIKLVKLLDTGLRKKYIISFISVSIIPAFIVLLLYLPIINLFRDEAIKTDSIRTNTIMNSIDERVLEMHSLSVQMSTNKKIREFVYKRAPLDNVGRYYIKDILDLVKSYKAGNSFVSLIAVYLTQSSSVVTHEGTYNDDYFFENILKYEGMGASDIKQMMAGNYYNKYLPLKKIKGYGTLNGEYVTYIQSIPIGETNALANVIMLIEEKNIIAMTGETKEKSNQQVMILTNQGEVVSLNPEDEKLKQVLFDKVEYESDSFVMDIPDKSSMVVSYSRSEVNDWIYIVFSSMDSIMFRISRIRNLAIIISVISFGIGVLLSIFMADFSYKPWVQLIDQMKGFYSKAAGSHMKSKNEYLIAMDAINNIRVEREQLQRDMNKSNLYIKKYILQNFCMGKNSSIDMVKGMPIFPYKLYCVIIVDIDDKVQLLRNIDKLLIKLVSIYFNKCVIYTFEDEKSRLCVVLNTGMYGNGLIVKQIKHLKDVVSSRFNVLLYVGIGGIYDDMGMIYNSHKEAKESLEYCFLKGKDSVVFYPDIEKYIFSSLNLPIHSDNPLLNSVKTGDIKNCTRLLDEYFNNVLDTGNASIQYMYCLFYNFVSVIIKACDEIHVDFEEIFSQTAEQILDISRYRNSRQIIDGVYNAYMIMCEYIQKNKKSHNNALKKHIDVYINENYTSKSISLIEMADKLGYSSSYLSRFIKQEFGVGFGEMLNKIRLERAKKLLSSEIRSIGEISEIVGYTSINSFTRAFKREEGITPSQYRNISLSGNQKVVRMT